MSLLFPVVRSYTLEQSVYVLMYTYWSLSYRHQGSVQHHGLPMTQHQDHAQMTTPTSMESPQKVNDVV